MEASRHRIPVVHARPVGLILNELVVNALKHAFPGGRAGTVTLEFHCRCGECFLTVRDDGVGMDRGVLPRGTGLGRRIVRALAAQVGGVVEVGPGRDGTGVECTVRWPAAKLDCELL
jgi:two-component sensor histidine kinase